MDIYLPIIAGRTLSSSASSSRNVGIGAKKVQLIKLDFLDTRQNQSYSILIPEN